MEEANDAASGVETIDEGLGDLNLDFVKKKKKKKSSSAKDAIASSEDATVGDEDNEADDDLSLDLSALTKKMRKKLAKEKIEAMTTEEGEGEDDDDDDDEDEEEDDEKAEMLRKYPWLESDRDYHYEELLDRVFGILRANNPELSGEKRRTILKPPQVVRQGTKTTIFTNFGELCGVMHRPFEHCMSYILAELGTSGSVDGQDRLNVKGRFMPKTFEGILRRYINEYVICNMCKSTDTVLTREHRLHVLRCNACGASRSVGAIKSGYVAQVGRRKKA